MPRTDIIVGVVTMLAVISGWRAGVIARLFSWIGVVAGFLLLPRVLPALNALFTPDTLGRTLAFNVAASVGVIIGAALVGRLVGRIIRFGVRLTPLSLIDRGAGVVLALAILFLALSSVLKAVAQFPSAAGDDVRRSYAYQSLEQFPFNLRRVIDLLPAQVADPTTADLSDGTASAHARR